MVDGDIGLRGERLVRAILYTQVLTYLTYLSNLGSLGVWGEHGIEFRVHIS